MKYSFNFGKSCYNKNWNSVAHQLGGTTVVVGETCAAYAASEAIIGRIAGSIESESSSAMLYGKNSVGAAERYYPSNIKKVNDSYLKNVALMFMSLNMMF